MSLTVTKVEKSGTWESKDGKSFNILEGVLSDGRAFNVLAKNPDQYKVGDEVEVLKEEKGKVKKMKKAFSGNPFGGKKVPQDEFERGKYPAFVTRYAVDVAMRSVEQFGECDMNPYEAAAEMTRIAEDVAPAIMKTLRVLQDGLTKTSEQAPKSEKPLFKNGPIRF